MVANLPKQLRKVTDKALLKRLSDGLERVEESIDKAVAQSDPIADQTSRHLTSAGGKRVRPTLLMLTSQFGEGITQRVVDASVVVELTHLATLYHDDVMDEAPMRRGVKTAHEIWGNSVAIITGDLLFARASQLVADLGGDALKLQADTFERLCLGQLHETMGPQAGDEAVAHYIQVLADKTGSLIATAAEMGIIYSNADSAYRQPVRDFGEKIGVAFQLIDDVIDLQSDGKTSGKTQGTDLLAHVDTLPTLYLRQLASVDDEARALLAQVDAVTPETLQGVIDQLKTHPVTQRTFDEAKRWADEAVSALATLPDGPAKQAMIAFAEAVIDRRN